jgi:hypothetical protein
VTSLDCAGASLLSISVQIMSEVLHSTSVRRNASPGPSRAGGSRATPPPILSGPPQVSVATETPISKRMSGSSLFSVSHLPEQDDVKVMLAQETKGRFVGSMPVQSFMDEFLPKLLGQKVCPRVNKQPFRKIPEGATEKSFYALLVSHSHCAA